MEGPKPGWKTSEFWLQLATQAATLWAAVQGFIPPKYAVFVTIVGSTIYTIGRVVIKAFADIKEIKAAQTTVVTTEPVTTISTPTTP